MSESKNKSTYPALWNPFWTLVWSAIFTPIFGAMIQHLNWKALGQDAQAASSLLWVKASAAFYVLYLVAEPWLPESDYLPYAFAGTSLLLWLVWMATNGLKQQRYVAEQFGQHYHHKLWGRPMMLGAFFWVIWMAVSLTYVLALILSGTIIIEAPVLP